MSLIVTVFPFLCQLMLIGATSWCVDISSAGLLNRVTRIDETEHLKQRTCSGDIMSPKDALKLIFNDEIGKPHHFLSPFSVVVNISYPGDLEDCHEVFTC